MSTFKHLEHQAACQILEHLEHQATCRILEPPEHSGDRGSSPTLAAMRGILLAFSTWAPELVLARMFVDMLEDAGLSAAELKAALMAEGPCRPLRWETRWAPVLWELERRMGGA